jgi:hypothetical protein
MNDAVSLRIALSILLALTLGACASISGRPTPGATLPLLPPASLGATHVAQQVLHVAFGAQDATINVVLTVSPQQLQVIGLNAVGMRLFTLEYDGATLKAERAPGLPEQVDPARILADLQLAYWPLPALQAAAQGSDWQITEPYAGTRRLRRGGRLIAEVHYADRTPWEGRVWLANYEVGYSLAVQSSRLDAQ